ncbi:hypothetical protein E4S40_03580 [Algoriphagus kandeliae]|uniref:DUF3575 domain-containing protein n=1 Tax=Algoriphagus kandeliae TaxID=2562278 RepID=A0A4Y9QZV5_9BACT|nr:hypothetical protein [Algoriphagus kandeliae]TFV97737.1 hypothetical protein E4S40_03580 [Algoriphagus kandeliae]
MRKILLAILFFNVWQIGFSQEIESEKSKEEEEEFSPIIRVALITGNSHVPNAFEGEKQVSIIPYWGFDVDYFVHPRWSFAIQGDLKLQSFEVEHEGVALERSYPFSLATVAHYHFKRHWSVYFGPGWEFEKNENLFLWKLGSEYSFELTETFEIALNLSYENKQEIYDSWNFGIAFNKLIWKKNK